MYSYYSDVAEDKEKLSELTCSGKKMRVRILLETTNFLCTQQCQINVNTFRMPSMTRFISN